MKRPAALCFLSLLLGWAKPGAAGAAGAEPFQFLFLDAGARPVGLGGAYTALASDANALLYNPAGLGQARRSEATFMHNQYFQGISQEYAAFASRRGWGLSVNYLSFGAVQRTTIASPDGSGLGSTGLSDLALGGGYGRALNDFLTVGAGLKLIRESIDAVAGQGCALDLGALFAAPSVRGSGWAPRRKTWAPQSGSRARGRTCR